MSRKLTAEEERQISGYMEICERLCRDPATVNSDVRQMLKEFVFQGPISACYLKGRVLNIRVEWLALAGSNGWVLAGHEQTIQVELDSINHMIEDQKGSVLMVANSNNSVDIIPPGDGRLKPEQVKGLET